MEIDLIFKIAAIEHRSNFKCQIDARNYKGLELGADVYSCNLDDFLVFSNNRAQALSFFRELIFQHVKKQELYLAIKLVVLIFQIQAKNVFIQTLEIYFLIQKEIIRHH